MTPDVRSWASSLIAGGIVAGVGIADFLLNNHSLSTLDVTLILTGAGAIAGKAVFDLGVQVPTPPKP